MVSVSWRVRQGVEAVESGETRLVFPGSRLFCGYRLVSLEPDFLRMTCCPQLCIGLEKVLLVNQQKP